MVGRKLLQGQPRAGFDPGPLFFHARGIKPLPPATGSKELLNDPLCPNQPIWLRSPVPDFGRIILSRLHVQGGEALFPFPMSTLPQQLPPHRDRGFVLLVLLLVFLATLAVWAMIGILAAT